MNMNTLHALNPSMQVPPVSTSMESFLASTLKQCWKTDPKVGREICWEEKISRAESKGVLVNVVNMFTSSFH